MILDYKTDRLPANFIFLGVFLLIVGVWRVLVSDWFGIILLVISFLCLFIRWGILIDTKKRRLKEYVSFLWIKKGNWKEIAKINHLEISTIHQTQNLSVASISRSDTEIVYKLFAVLPNENIEIIRGKKDYINKVESEISAELQIKIVDETD